MKTSNEPTDSTSANEGSLPPKEITGRLAQVASIAVAAECPQCKGQMLVPGEPFGDPRRIEAFMAGHPLNVRCGGCGAEAKVKRSLIAQLDEKPAATPVMAPGVNRHERRKLVALK